CVLCLSLVFSFFFPAEDGIRAFHVTGVQTCALPISERRWRRRRRRQPAGTPSPTLRSRRAHGAASGRGCPVGCPPGQAQPRARRSEERRVGDEWWPGGRRQRQKQRTDIP